MNRIGKELVEVYSRLTIEGLFWLLGNQSDDFGVAFRRDDQVKRVHPIHWFKGSVIQAAIRTMSGAPGAEGNIAFIPSCQKGFFAKSCWGGLRISPALDETIDVTDRRVRSTFNCLRAYAYGRSIIVEACGDGSWQFWAIRHGFSAHKTWWKLLEKVSREAGIIGEIFPSKDDVLGMPAPGSWDPATDRLSRIVYADLTAISRECVYSAFGSVAIPIPASPVVQDVN